MKLTQEERARVACHVIKKVMKPYVGESITQEIKRKIIDDVTDYFRQAKEKDYFMEDAEVKITFDFDGVKINITGTLDEEEQNATPNSQERQQTSQIDWEAFDKLIPEL